MVDPGDFIVKLTAIFRQELDNNDLTISMDTLQSNLESWDSLAHVRIVMGVERTFGIQLEVAEIESINSVRGFYNAVSSQVS